MKQNPAIHDNLDHVLSRYFHAQLPQAWPASPCEVETVRTATTARSAPARLTLAASIALLLGLGGMLSYSPQSRNAPADSGLLNDASANGKNLEKHIFPDHQPKLPGTQP
jgi:hypothetical protein